MSRLSTETGPSPPLGQMHSPARVFHGAFLANLAIRSSEAQTQYPVSVKTERTRTVVMKRRTWCLPVPHPF